MNTAVSQSLESPMNSLNQQFNSQNGDLENLVLRLRDALNRLSQQPEQKQCATQPNEPEPLPFNDGHLMAYYKQNKVNSNLLSLLRDEVCKAESLI